jgi:hypothetical protein
MEPFEELKDDELDNLLQGWQTPDPPVGMQARVFAQPVQATAPWWRRLWTASVRVPVPLAACLLLAAGAGVWKYSVTRVEPHVVVKTERVEVPTVTERVVTQTIYRDRPAPVLRSAKASQLQPVTELRPRIIRSQDANN